MSHAVAIALTSIPAPVLASFADVFRSVVGVILALCGLCLLLMGLVAACDREWRTGALGALFGAGLVAAGLWLVGAFA